MIYVVHGENTALSRTLILNHFKNKNFNSRTEVDIAATSPERLFELTHTSDIFGNRPLVIFDVTEARGKQTESYAKVIGETPKDATLIIYSAKPLPKTNPVIRLATEQKLKIIENEAKPEGNIFKLIDSVLGANRKAAYNELAKLARDGTDPFYIFSMLLFGIRNMVHCFVNSEKFGQMKPFMQEKLKKQAEKLSMQKVESLFENLYVLDVQSKTGGVSPELMLTLAVEKMLNS